MQFYGLQFIYQLIWCITTNLLTLCNVHSVGCNTLPGHTEHNAYCIQCNITISIETDSFFAPLFARNVRRNDIWELFAIVIVWHDAWMNDERDWFIRFNFNIAVCCVHVPMPLFWSSLSDSSICLSQSTCAKKSAPQSTGERVCIWVWAQRWRSRGRRVETLIYIFP